MSALPILGLFLASLFSCAKTPSFSSASLIRIEEEGASWVEADSSASCLLKLNLDDAVYYDKALQKVDSYPLTVGEEYKISWDSRDAVCPETIHVLALYALH